MSRVAAWRLHSCTISIAWTNRKESVPMTVTALGELLIDLLPSRQMRMAGPCLQQVPAVLPPTFAPWRPSWARRRRLWER